jgi:hypothetical protein
VEVSECGAAFRPRCVGEKPILFLSRDISGAYRILNSEAPHGKVARVRDATHLMLVHQVWSSLLATALTALVPLNQQNGEMTTEEKLAELKGWAPAILRDWSRYIYPEPDADTALQRLVDAGGDTIKTGEVMARLANAIQSRFSSHVAFQKLWETIEGT